ncbi:cytochrome c family protein [bacterium]|nr:cytochrome c family protein [bacterium]
MKILVAILIVVFGAQMTVAQDTTAHKFVGALKCKLCHNTEKSGHQYKKWKESKHAQAYATLSTNKAKEFGKAKGIDDPQKSPACLKCHVTAYTIPAVLKDEKYSIEEGVSCESCPGAGGDYWRKEIMVDVYNKKIDRVSVGLRIPDQSVCITCHNPDSPGYKEFKFEEFLQKISHKIPK